MSLANVTDMIFFRRRGWIVLPLAVLSLMAPMFAFPKGTSLEASTTLRIAVCASFLVAGAFLFWFGHRSMKSVASSLDRPLRAHEQVLDVAPSSPFDSFCFIHLRWWSLAFAVVGAWFAAGMP